jgi:hypothetical protein
MVEFTLHTRILCLQYGTCFMSPFWSLKLGGGSMIFGKILDHGLVYCKQTPCMSQRILNKVSLCLTNTTFRCTAARTWLYAAMTLVYAIQCNVNYGIQIHSPYGCLTNTLFYSSIPLLTGQVSQNCLY